MPQNFQNWMASDRSSDPTSPSGIPGTEFQDWSNLTGPSDLMKSSFGGARTASAPIAPPQNWGQAFDQAIAPFQQKIGNVTNAFGQLGQGNTFNAYSALKGQQPVAGQQPQAAQQSSTDGGFDFSR